jgi:hypothetical protein
MTALRLTAFTVLALSLALASSAEARPAKLKPASPQPAGLSEGLAVDYAFPGDVQSLRDAYVALGTKGKPGAPLTAGLNYLAGSGNRQALTSGQEHKVAARIKGYMKFDAPGDYTLEVYSNDGVQITLGGREIVKVDAKRSCDPTGEVEVRIPEAGWYEIEALYWQRKGSSCLIMEWAKEGGELDVVPASAFGFK